MDVAIVGGGAALAQPLIRHLLDRGDTVVAVCRKTRPVVVGDCRLDVVVSVEELAGLERDFDALVTMTGSVENCTLRHLGPDAWGRVIESTLTSVYRALRACLCRMREPGNVVVVGSVVGSTGGKGCANYAAAKAGLVGLVRAAANEWARYDVVVNLLELGYVDAGMGARLDPKVREEVLKTIPLRRFATEDEVVQAIDYLMKVRYMTGNILTLAGGLR